MVVQVLSCVDVGQSAYSQLQNLLKVDNENVTVSADTVLDSSVEPTQYRQAAWEPKTSRMLKLVLTDGFQTIKAIEHEPIHDLKYPMNPGCKLKLKPPITCRRGVMMLTRKNVEFLGGEFSFAAVLASFSTAIFSTTSSIFIKFLSKKFYDLNS